MTSWITPACAGKRVLVAPSSMPSRDHPRVCGEKAVCVRRADVHQGSPPRVRGKVPPLSGFRHDDGITPACAGKSFSCCTVSAAPRDHPRVCGEKNEKWRGECFDAGSPPRVRGKAFSGHSASCIYRITPACAGKSRQASILLPNPQDHPRVCGEKTKESLKK